MITPRHRPFATLLATALVGLAACHEAVAPTAVRTERADARGGNKGGGVEAPSLEEFYVFVDGSGQQTIHTVVAGPVSEVGFQTVVDHFPDGVRTKDPHYEYFELHAPRDAGSMAGDGARHVDLPFEGKISNDATFFDHPYLDVDGAGSDPFAFVVLAFGADGAVTRMAPGGVLDAGRDLHGGADRSSTGIFRGPAAPNEIWVDQIAVSSVSCVARTVVEGRGKNRSERTVTDVIVEGDVSFGTSGPGAPDDPWRELHLHDAASGVLSARQTYGSGSGFRLGLQLDGAPGDLYVVVDFVHPDAGWGVYAPGRNATAASAPGLDVPGVLLAVSAPVECPGP